jgi:hypothetical protein
VPYSGNFTNLTFVNTSRETGGSALRVEGTSREPERAKEIIVGIPHDGQLLVASVEGATSSDWHATFPQGVPPFAEGDSVIVVGVAILKEDPPFFWADRMDADALTAPPP